MTVPKERGYLISAIPSLCAERGRSVWFDEGLRSICTLVVDHPELVGVIVYRDGGNVGAFACAEAVLREPWRVRWTWSPARFEFVADTGARILMLAASRIDRLNGMHIDAALEYDDAGLSPHERELVLARMRGRVTRDLARA